MKFIAEITVMPLNELLDPQGKAITESLHNLGLNTIENVRVGKHISIHIEAENEEQAKAKTEEACKQLLVNPVMEYYNYKLSLN